MRISSKKNLKSHSASPALSKSINSDSIVDRVIQVCLKDFQDTAPPPRVKNITTYGFGVFSARYLAGI